MNLHTLLKQHDESKGPIRVGVIGAGKFSAMFLTQALSTPGIHVVGVADLDTRRVAETLSRTGWPEERYAAGSLDQAVANGSTFITDSADRLLEDSRIEVILEITGNPSAGVYHALKSIDNGKHIIMVNVEADCLVGPLLRGRAERAGVVYSMAYGDQPALICEMVDWCRTVGYEVVSAGKGTKYLPEYNYSTPDTVWQHYGLTAEQVAKGGFNPKMFNSFLDGTKSAIEMAAVANGTGLIPQESGLYFPPASTEELAEIFRSRALGGSLEHNGTVEVASCLRRDGSEIERHLRWGVFVTFLAQTDYAARCFAEYGVPTDSTGNIASLYRPYHMIGMELGVSVASVALRREPTGAPHHFHGDVVATAKGNLQAGDLLDGEGGYCVFGKLMPAQASLRQNALPLGLAHNVKLKRNVAKDAVITWDDVEVEDSLVVKTRREMEKRFLA